MSTSSISPSIDPSQAPPSPLFAPGDFGMKTTDIAPIPSYQRNVKQPQDIVEDYVSKFISSSEPATRVATPDNLKHVYDSMHSSTDTVSCAEQDDSDSELELENVEVATLSHSWLFSYLESRGVPVSHQVLDLEVLGLDTLALKSKIGLVLNELFPTEWSAEGLVLRRISGAMTNVIYQVSSPMNRMGQRQHVLLRIYGVGADQFVKRDKELLTTCRLSGMHVCPKLLGAFANGRFEEYMDSVTLTRADIRHPRISSQIAVELAKIHQLIDTIEEEEKTHAELWETLDSWLELSKKAIPECNRLRLLDDKLDIDERVLEQEIAYLKHITSTLSSPLVFAHNDLQYGNIMKLNKPGDPIMIVDYEYSGPNYRGFDIGNHFCEWAADYHSDEPHRMHFERYPTLEEQQHFIRAYLDQIHKKEGQKTTNEQVKHLVQEARVFALCSHFLWGVWGIVQAPSSQISFDYIGYSKERFEEYFKQKQLISIDTPLSKLVV